jgi:hypothetical protein
MFMRMAKPGGGGTPPATLSFRGSNTLTTDTATYTFSSQDIGTAAGDRRVVVMWAVWAQNTTNTVTGVTIAGVAATIGQLTSAGGGSLFRLGYAIANVPSGTTGNVVISMSGSGGFNASIGVWAVYGLLSSTPTATGADNALAGDATANISLAIQAGGVAIGAHQDVSNAATRTWSGLTEDYDVAGTENNARSGASTTSLTATTLSISVTRSTTAQLSVAGAIALR